MQNGRLCADKMELSHDEVAELEEMLPEFNYTNEGP
jgi:hypothetical protein